MSNTKRMFGYLILVIATTFTCANVIAVVTKRMSVADGTWRCGPDDRENRDNHNTITYTNQDVERALFKGYELLNEEYFRGRYPHPYRWEDAHSLDRRCPENRNRLQLYPILQGATFSGDDPGLDRVIFDAFTGYFCGVLTHRGGSNNRLYPCHYSDPTQTTSSSSSTTSVVSAPQGLLHYDPFTMGLPPDPNPMKAVAGLVEDAAIAVAASGVPTASEPGSTPSAAAVGADPQCETPSFCSFCSGNNHAINATFGVCQEGDCTGYLCFNVCPPTPAQCGDPDCYGVGDYVGSDPSATCQLGEYAGCPCTASCPDTPLPCPSCNGTSYQNGTGLCGSASGKYAGCPCDGACTSNPMPQCDIPSCGGYNGQNGTAGVCLDGPLLGCQCASICPEAPVSCDAPGCGGWNTDDGGPLGSCRLAPLAGCQCEPVCGQTESELCWTVADCGALCTDDGCFCTQGTFQGCSCLCLPGLMCSDDDCSGVDGVCVSGDSAGCPCT